jgi:acetoacetyl-CoA synthetase
MSEPMWTPSEARVTSSNMRAFMDYQADVHGREFEDYRALHAWSVEDQAAFWSDFWDWSEVIAETKGDRILIDGDKMPGAQYFPDAKLNFAENLLRHASEGPALIFRREDGMERTMSGDELEATASRVAQALLAMGVEPGDRVAAYLPNIPESVACMAGAAAIGAVWTSCSPDFGVQGVLDRFGQIEPKVMLTVDGYVYAGKGQDIREKVAEVVAGLPKLEKLVVIPFLENRPDLKALAGAELFDTWLADFPAGPVPYKQLPFDHPLYILYSSGTTGVPKCIVHCAGGVLLQHLKEHILHVDVKLGDRLFYFTTKGWMLWNWLTTGLASGATLMLYDGSPFHPNGNVLWDYAAEHKFKVFGASAKFIEGCQKGGITPATTHDLSELKTILSTGSVLLPEGFDYVYEHVKEDVCLASIAGGTDLVACLVGGDPTNAVYPGEIQAPMLGMDTATLLEDGTRAPVGEKGELCCLKPCPSLPLGFWDDPDGSRYHAAYYDVYPNIWRHGDYAAFTETGGMVIYGRSDATLNPGGVRIGTAEIYRQVEQLEEVVESIVIGQEWQGDTRVVLFVRLRDGLTLDDDLIQRIRNHVRQHASPRHVPAKVVQVQDIPRTRSGKIVELAVRDMVHGHPIKNKEALDNPEALEHFRDRSELV